MSENEIGIIYGQHRLNIAAMYGIDPAAVTLAHVEEYERIQEGQAE